MKLFFNESLNNKTNIDPRTKILILLMVSAFVFSGLGGGGKYIHIIRTLLISIPFILLIFNRQYKVVLFYGTMYFLFYLLQVFVLNNITGIFNFILLFSIGVFVRIMPGVLTAYYVISTTTVSELVASMQKMKISEKIIIPLSVMFRFFPTVIEESNSVSHAMKMRGIYLGGKKPSKIIEYRLIPMITCSVKAGEELSASALSRGLGSPIKRTNICCIGFNLLDYIIFALCILTILLYILG